MDTYYAIILVLIILAIGYYMYSTGSPSNANNNNSGTNNDDPAGPGTGPVCTGNQICMESCGGASTPTSMFEFIFEYKCINCNGCANAGSYAVFDDVGQSDGGDNQNHFMTIEDTSKQSNGSGIIYQYFIPVGSSQFFGGHATNIITSSSGSPYAMLICPSKLNPTSNGSPSKYIGIVVNYTYSNSKLSYSRENVMNPANKKTIIPTISSGNGATVSSYLGSCDLTPWFTSLSPADQALVGVFNSQISIRLDNNDVCDDMFTSEIDLIGLGGTVNIFNAVSGVPYGVSIFSYTLNSQAFTLPCPSLFNPSSNDIGVTYL